MWFIDTKLWIVLGWKCYKSLYITWELLMLPMFLSFVATYLNKEQEIKKHYKYPFYLSLIIHFIIVISNFTIVGFFKKYGDIIRTYDLFINYFKLVFIAFITYKIFKLIFSFENKTYTINIVTVKTKWLKQLLYATLGTCILSFSFLIYNAINKTDIKDDFVWAIMSILLYWLCYSGIYHLGIFNQRQEIRTVILSQKKEEKTKKINFNNATKFEEIATHIKRQKLYLNPSLSLTLLSEKFNLSEGHLSRLVNNYSKTNFTTYINNLRIEEAKLLLKNEDYRTYTIIAIALEAGFNSKSAFYSAFKNQTGLSPSTYRKSL